MKNNHRQIEIVMAPSVAPEYVKGLLRIANGSTDVAMTQIELFRERSSLVLTNLKEALKLKDQLTYADLAHALAGSAAVIQATPLRLLCLDGEKSARAGETDRLFLNASLIAEELLLVEESLQRQLVEESAFGASVAV
jgi:HPt (histidine-containing phosphotransfer) domain-containing protein